MVFIVDLDELQRAMQEVAARQDHGPKPNASPPPSDAPGLTAGANAGNTAQAPAATPAPRALASVNNFSTFNPYAGIDYNVIAKHEGAELRPYVPPGNSGLTAAHGVDFSEHTAEELRNWGVSENTIAKLTPFLKPSAGSTSGPKRDATSSPKISPLDSDYRIPVSDALAMDDGAFKSITGYLQHAYDAANPAIPFAQLPDAVRTAIVDAAYQNGPDLAANAPRFWHAVTTGDWMAAADEMHNWTEAQKADPNAPRTQRQLDDEELLRVP